MGLNAQTNGTPERYTALAVNMDRGTSGTIEIVVDRWATDQQRDTLMSVVKTVGPAKLLDALQDMPRMGYLRTPDSIGWDIHFARKIPGEDGGYRVVLLTDRRIGFWEAVNRPRSIDYPFTFIELRLNRDGEGEGKMSLATKIIADERKQCGHSGCPRGLRFNRTAVHGPRGADDLESQRCGSPGHIEFEENWRRSASPATHGAGPH